MNYSNSLSISGATEFATIGCGVFRWHFRENYMKKLWCESEKRGTHTSSFHEKTK